MGTAMAEQAKILVADDDDGVRAFLLASLRRHGHHCVEARDATEATRLLRTESLDLAVVDVHMPGNDGLELLRAGENAERQVPVIIISGRADPELIIESFRLGAVDWISKPITHEALASRVVVALARATSLSAVRQARSDVEKWAATMSSMSPGPGLSMESYITQSFLLMARLSANLQGAVSGAAAPRDLCSGLRCARRAELERAVRRSIDVLEKTKGSFKSKELGELRTALEVVLEKTARL